MTNLRWLAGAAVAVCAVAAWTTVCADDDPLAAYRVTKVTQTEERGTDGKVKRVEVVNESRVAVQERTVESLVPEAAGNLVLSSRTRWKMNTDGSQSTIVEQAVAGQKDLVVVSVTTEVKDTDGGSETVVETRGEDGRLVVTRHVVSELVDGALVTTVKTPDAAGRLQVSARTVKQP